MTTARQIEAFIYGFAPKRFKMDFDNVGLLIGDGDAEVTKALLALDITPDVVDEAIGMGAQCIVTHHPVIFHPRKNITDGDPYGAMMMKMIRHGVAGVCMHTNLDLAPLGVNEMLALRLGLEELEVFSDIQQDEEMGVYGLGRIGTYKEPMPREDFCAHVKKALGSNGIRYVLGKTPVKKVAVGGGHCGDLMPEAVEKGCDAFVTSDLGYNDSLDAKELGITLIDAGHYPTENVVIPQLYRWLTEKYPDVEFCISRVHREVIEYM